MKWLGFIGLVLAAFCWLSAAAGAGSPDDPDELDRVWRETIVIFPQEPAVTSLRTSDIDDSVDRLKLAGRYPAAIFLHGSYGLHVTASEVRVLARFLARSGLVVFAPDGLARPREPYSDPKTFTSWITYDDVQARIAEARSTLRRISELPWIDRENIFLVGHSMGGLSTANYPDPDFRGYIISAYHCNVAADPRNSGVSIPHDMPVLALRGTLDPWFSGPNERADCGSSMRGHTQSRSVVLKGATHEVFDEADARAEISAFLKSFATRPISPVPRATPSPRHDGTWNGRIECSASGPVQPFTVPIRFELKGGRGAWRATLGTGVRGFDVTIDESDRFLAIGDIGPAGFVEGGPETDPAPPGFTISFPGAVRDRVIEAFGQWGTNWCRLAARRP